MNIEKTLPKAWEEIAKKESSISKKSGFNLDKSDAVNSNATNTLATSAAVKTAYDKGVEALTDSNTKLAKGNLPAKITNAEDMYKLLENKSGLEFDPNLLYLNDAGTKTAGKAYFDRNKKGIFKCIQTTSSTTNSTTYFVDFSNNANSDRLTNIGTVEYLQGNSLNYHYLEYVKISNIVIIHINSSQHKNIVNDFSFPIELLPKEITKAPCTYNCLVASMGENYASGTVELKTDGSLLLHTSSYPWHNSGDFTTTFIYSL